MAKIEEKTKGYPSDLTDEEWSAVEPFMPKAGSTGSPWRTDLREVLNATPPSGSLRLRMADAAHPFPTLADGVLVVSSLGEAPDVSHRPRDRPDVQVTQKAFVESPMYG